MTKLLDDKVLDTPSVDPVVDDDSSSSAFERLVGEGKKFKDAEALARSKEFTDAHIKTIEQELAIAREQINQSLTLKDFMAELRKTSNANALTSSDNHDEENDDATAHTAQLNEKALEEKIAQLMRDRDVKAVQARNIESVREEMEKQWGANWKPVLLQKAKEAGVAPEFLESTAGQSPKAFFRLVGLSGSPMPSSSIPRASVRSDVHVKGEKTYKHYKEQMQADPSLLHNRKFTDEMHAQARKLGDSFYA